MKTISREEKRPLTLLEMGGSEIPFTPKASAIVFIDYQQEYTIGKLPLYEVETAVAEAHRLMQWGRKHKLPIIHILHQGTSGGAFDPNTQGGKVIPPLSPIENESVVHKTLPNGFAGTNLDQTLKKHQAKSIVFAGLMTHMCLDATVRAAFDLGYAPLVVASTSTTRDLPGPGTETVPASTLKKATLAGLQDLVAAVDNTVADLQSRFVE